MRCSIKKFLLYAILMNTFIKKAISINSLFKIDDIFNLMFLSISSNFSMPVGNSRKLLMTN